MMRLLIPAFLLISGTGIGVGAGLWTLPSGSASDPADPSDQAALMQGGEALGSDFVRLNNQFVVPVVREERVRSLVVLSLTLEVPRGATAATYDVEPKLRDQFLRVLFDHANMGGFDGAFTQASSLDLLRRALIDAAKLVLPVAVHDVLITDIARQDM